MPHAKGELKTGLRNLNCFRREKKNPLNISGEALTIQETVPVEKVSVFLTSLKVMEGEKRAGSRVSREFMLMEGFKRERVKVKGS